MPFKIKDLMISDLSESAPRFPYETCRPISEGCLHFVSYITCGACTVITNHFPTITCGACTVITHHFPTITCGACTVITHGACTVVTGPWTDNTCGACTVITRGGCTAVTDTNCINVSCGFYTWEGAKAKDAGTSSAASLAALSTLKEQLKQQLAEVEKEQAAVEESLLPQTVEQVDELSKKLTEALQELKVLKQKLSSKPKPAGGK
jgi:hypothetical protein